MKIRFAVGPGASQADLAGYAAAIDALEASGFDGVWLSDVPMSPAVDPLIGLALAAGRTTRLKLGANLVPLGRNPYLLAKQLAQLDRLSNGRLLLSFVPGLGQPGEREALGVAGRDRGVLLEDAIDALRRWWRGEAVDDVTVATTPEQDPLEIWLGGMGPKALDRAGRIADGWLGAAVTPREAGEARRLIETAADRTGRRIDPEHFGLSIPYARTPPPASALEGLRARRPDLDPGDLVPAGREALRALVRSLVDEGLSKFVVRPMGPVASWPDELDWLAGAVLDLQT